MNNLFQENKNAFLLILALLFLLLLVFFFLFFQPLSKDLKAKETEAKQVENDIALLEAEVEKVENQDEGKVDFKNLQLAKKMPMDPELENLILTLEEIEMVSESRFESISFSYDGSVPERYVEEVEETEENTEDGVSTTQEETEASEEEQETAEEVSESVIDMEAKPDNLHVITVSMSVTSPDYEQFQTFVQEIEKQERMMMVSSMNFENPAENELVLAEEPSEAMTIEVDITTFYYED